MSKKQIYRVTGSRIYRGVKPGQSFEAEPSPVLDEAVRRGNVTLEEEGALESKTREELDALASAAGVEEAEKLNDKAAVAKAIRATEKE
jgi:hypothetical protein